MENTASDYRLLHCTKVREKDVKAKDKFVNLPDEILFRKNYIFLKIIIL